MLNENALKSVIKEVIDRGLEEQIHPTALKQVIAMRTGTVDIAAINRAITSMVKLGILIGNEESNYRLGSFAYSFSGLDKKEVEVL